MRYCSDSIGLVRVMKTMLKQAEFAPCGGDALLECRKCYADAGALRVDIQVHDYWHNRLTN